MKRRDLAFEARHEIARVNSGMAGDVVNWLFRIQRGALAAHFGQCIDQHAGELQHPEFEHREQANRACADDRNIRIDLACHPQPS